MLQQQYTARRWHVPHSAKNWAEHFVMNVKCLLLSLLGCCYAIHTCHSKSNLITSMADSYHADLNLKLHRDTNCILVCRCRYRWHIQVQIVLSWILHKHGCEEVKWIKGDQNGTLWTQRQIEETSLGCVAEEQNEVPLYIFIQISHVVHLT